MPIDGILCFHAQQPILSKRFATNKHVLVSIILHTEHACSICSKNHVSQAAVAGEEEGVEEEGGDGAEQQRENSLDSRSNLSLPALSRASNKS